MLAWPQQEIAEEKWPGQAMHLSGLVPASPVEVGAHPLVKLTVAALSSGLQMPPLLSLPPGPVAAWSPPALGEFFWSGRVTVVRQDRDADVLPAVARSSRDLDEVHNLVKQSNHFWQIGPSTRQWARLHLTTTIERLLSCPHHCFASYVALRWAMVNTLWPLGRRVPKNNLLGVELLGHERSRS